MAVRSSRPPSTRSSPAAGPPAGLGRALRLRRSGDFTRVERQGVRASGRFVVVVVKKSGAHAKNAGRVGFTVSKKVGNAVARNFVKRRLREIARAHKALWQGRDLVIIAKPEAAFQELRALEADLLGALKKLEENARGPTKAKKPD